MKTLSTTLPPGVYAKIPTVPTLCNEAQAKAGACPAASLVGTVTAKAGSGTPFAFGGLVYLTGPDEGAPYGLNFQVPVVAGPFNLGQETTHAKIEVNPNTARVVVSSPVPTIRAGIPTRIRELTVNLTRANYAVNPTNCGLAENGIDRDLDVRRDRGVREQLPGRRLQQPALQADVQGHDQRQILKSQRREPRNHGQHARRRREHEVDTRPAAQAAAVAPDHAAESVH